MWDPKEVKTFKGHTSSVASVAFSHDGKTIASGSGDLTVKLWSLDGMERNCKPLTGIPLALLASPLAPMVRPLPKVEASP